MPLKKEISLLPDKDNPNSFSGRVLLWLTSVGRYVIVITELLVISGFISRFWLDRQNADLSEAIRQKKAIVESTVQFEKDYKIIQDKLFVIKDAYAKQSDFSNKIITLADSTPDNIIYQNFNASIVNDLVTLNLSASALTEKAVVEFVGKLLKQKQIQSVDIKTIEKKPKDNKYSINLVITFKNDTKK